ncbi:HalOD1 output domain-containing protein [Halobacterium wangiae]|uniref:HalOD1 output domain-containing protein n=1 Tax=Halobacterium wangiae TaxID=2902623 RepID=UPI001E62792D|nr:HalOD1 output domain-containing protein [Halobacterium wangiae]
MSEDSGREVVHRELDPERGEPNVQIAEIVAELKDTDASELTNMYSCIDHTIDHIFSNPPSPEADVEVRFSYEGSRITVEQNGTATIEQRQ